MATSPGTIDLELLFAHVPVDLAVIGEAEVTLPQIIITLTNPSPWDWRGQKGVAFRDASGNPFVNEPQPRVDITTQSITQSFDFFDHREWVEQKGELPILTGRGCPGTCTFCSPSHRKFLPRLLEDVFQEIDTITSRFGEVTLNFLNEVSFGDEAQYVQFCREYQRRFRAPFRMLCRLDTPPEVLRHLRKAGCISLGIGVESGSDKVLKAMAKNTTVEMARNFVQEAKRQGFVDITSGFMFGNQKETEQDINLTLRLFDELQIKGAPSYTIPYPGTVLYKRARAKGLIPDPYHFLHTLPTFYGSEFLTDVLFLKDPGGRNIFNNLTDIPDDRFWEVMHRVNVHFMDRLALQNAHLYWEGGQQLMIRGSCPACGGRMEAELNPVSPVVRVLRCPRADTGECYNDLPFYHAHIYRVPEIASYADKVRNQLDSCNKIGFFGDNFNIKFLLDHDIFGVSFTKIAGMATRSVERFGSHVYADAAGNMVEESLLITPEELVGREPEAIIVAEMPPGGLAIRDILLGLDYPDERIMLMARPDHLPTPA